MTEMPPGLIDYIIENSIYLGDVNNESFMETYPYVVEDIDLITNNITDTILWCKEFILRGYRIKMATLSNFYFESSADATAFKLRWI